MAMELSHSISSHISQGSETQGVYRTGGEPGVWLLILGDMWLFSILFFYFFYDRGSNISIFQTSSSSLDVTLGVINTLVLLTSSLMVVVALQAYRMGRIEQTVRYLLTAVVFGALFCGIKYFEYQSKLADGITPISNEFFMYYFVLTGMHLVHVVVGMSVLAYFIFKIRNDDQSSGRPDLSGQESMESAANYWHMVDLLWIMIFPLLYLMG